MTKEWTLKTPRLSLGGPLRRRQQSAVFAQTLSRMFRATSLAAVLVFTVMLSACSNSPTGPGPVSLITLSGSSTSFASLGETIQLAASVTDAGGRSITGKQLVWNATPQSVATVNSATGVVTAVSNGNVSISATVDGVTGSLQMSVQQVIATVAVTSPSDTIRALNETMQFTAVARDARNNPMASPGVVTWLLTTGSPTIASIDQNGLVTSAAEGDFTVQATVNTKTGTRLATVKQMGSALRVATEPAGAQAGVALGTQPRVEVIDSRGNIVASENGTTITAVIASGGGTITGSATATTTAGAATFQSLGIGGLVGARTLNFTSPGKSAATSASFQLAAGPPASITLVSGSGQTAPANTALPAPLVANVKDAFNNAVSAANVGWSVVTGTGSPASPTTATAADGNASVSYTLGLQAITETVSASIPASPIAPVNFTATATPNGIISGTVTLGALGLPASATSQGTASVSSAPAARYVPRELLVSYSGAALSAPAAGSAQFRNMAVATQTATTIRAALAQREAAGRYSVDAVSPAILMAKVTVPDGQDIDAVIAELRADPRVSSVSFNNWHYSDDVKLTPVEKLLASAGLGASATHSRTMRSGFMNSLLPPFASSRAPLPGIDPRLLSHSGRVPNDPHYPSQAWNYNAISAPEAWNITTGSNAVIVAVVDDGIRFDHPAIAANLTADGYDFVTPLSIPLCAGGSILNSDDGNGYDPDPTIPSAYLVFNNQCVFPPPNGLGAHGLHVAGTIGAAGDDNLTVTGVNWNVRIRPIRVLGAAGGTDFDIAQGILYAAGLTASGDGGIGVTPPPSQPAHVINMSIGGPGGAAMAAAVTAASNAGVLMVASAGNNGNTAANYPAWYPEVMSVASIGPDWQRAAYSSFGINTDLTAPGGDLNDGNFTFGVNSTRWLFTNNTPAYEHIHGTSMAAPHVTGVAALIFAANPGITPQQVWQRLITYAVDLGTPGFDITNGHGLVNARNALTQSMNVATGTRVVLRNPATGQIVATATPNGSGAYSFGQLANGSYTVHAGETYGQDNILGLPPLRWGALGGSAAPTMINITQAGTTPASFSIGTPFETENNNTTNVADELPLNSYMAGNISSVVGDSDYYRLVIPSAGNYALETLGFRGACGFAGESDTILTLFDAVGGQLATNNDLNAGASQLCSSIVMMLQPGTYFVRVTGASVGGYMVVARSAPI